MVQSKVEAGQDMNLHNGHAILIAYGSRCLPYQAGTVNSAACAFSVKLNGRLLPLRIAKITGPNLFALSLSVRALAGYFRLNWSNLCT